MMLRYMHKSGTTREQIAQVALTARDGILPMNTGGGQLAGGRLHGFGGIFEACVQARGEAGARQVRPVPDATVVSSGTGTFSSCILIGSAPDAPDHEEG